MRTNTSTHTCTQATRPAPRSFLSHCRTHKHQLIMSITALQLTVPITALIISYVPKHDRANVALTCSKWAAIVRDYHLNSPRRAVVALIGPEGSGKSTVLDNLWKLTRDRQLQSLCFRPKPTQQRNRRRFHNLALQNRQLTLVWCPGKVQFMMEQMRSLCEAHVCVLCINATTYVKQWKEIKQLILMWRGLSIQRKMVVVLTHADALSQEELQPVLEDCSARIRKYLALVAPNVSSSAPLDVSIVCTGSAGQHLVDGYSETLPVWNDRKSLLTELIEMELPQVNFNRPFCMPIDEIIENKDSTTVMGVVRSGVLVHHSMSDLYVCPAGVGTAEVLTRNMAGFNASNFDIRFHQLNKSNISSMGDSTIEGRPGAPLKMTFPSKIKHLKRGAIISASKALYDCHSFTAKLLVINPPKTKGLYLNYKPSIFANSAHSPCVIAHIAPSETTAETSSESASTSASTSAATATATATTNSPVLKRGDIATVTIRPQQPIVVEQFDLFPELGRFLLFDQHVVVAVGIVKYVRKHLPLAQKLVRMQTPQLQYVLDDDVFVHIFKLLAQRWGTRQLIPVMESCSLFKYLCDSEASFWNEATLRQQDMTDLHLRSFRLRFPNLVKLTVPAVVPSALFRDYFLTNPLPLLQELVIVFETATPEWFFSGLPHLKKLTYKRGNSDISTMYDFGSITYRELELFDVDMSLFAVMQHPNITANRVVYRNFKHTNTNVFAVTHHLTFYNGTFDGAAMVSALEQRADELVSVSFIGCSFDTTAATELAKSVRPYVYPKLTMLDVSGSSGLEDVTFKPGFEVVGLKQKAESTSTSSSN